MRVFQQDVGKEVKVLSYAHHPRRHSRADGEMDMADLDLACGSALREARERLGLSDKRLAALSGVSRKHVADAQRGVNISRDVLKKLMRTLELKQIELDDGSTLKLGGADRIIAALDDVDQGVHRLLSSVAKLRGLVVHASVEPPPDQTTDLQDLIRGLQTRLQQTPPTEDEVRALEQTLDALGSAGRTSSVAPRRTSQRQVMRKTGR
jgi:transcriptional regulator with XRE-family HTH domain